MKTLSTSTRRRRPSALQEVQSAVSRLAHDLIAQVAQDKYEVYYDLKGLRTLGNNLKAALEDPYEKLDFHALQEELTPTQLQEFERVLAPLRTLKAMRNANIAYLCQVFALPEILMLGELAMQACSDVQPAWIVRNQVASSFRNKAVTFIAHHAAVQRSPKGQQLVRHIVEHRRYFPWQMATLSWLTTVGAPPTTPLPTAEPQAQWPIPIVVDCSPALCTDSESLLKEGLLNKYVIVLVNEQRQPVALYKRYSFAAILTLQTIVASNGVVIPPGVWLEPGSEQTKENMQERIEQGVKVLPLQECGGKWALSRGILPDYLKNGAPHTRWRTLPALQQAAVKIVRNNP